MKKQLLAILFLSFSITVFSQQINIIPKPNDTKITSGNFAITTPTVIVYGDDGEKNTANFLNSYLKKFYGFQLKISKQATSNYIQLSTKKFIKAPDNSAAYSLTITPKNITISGDGYEGTFYGMQSLIGLLPIAQSQTSNHKLVVPCLVINDA
ncbi:MAG: glycoside hydrolase family 20 zincin-like fold domain-containing protein, partial [Pedobacter sp.]|nr:glycoside hydrolase family 20 zincin-like fold domain-containing protein [Chitinophagaceae bacterium]